MSKKGRIGDRYRKVTISKENVKKQNKKQYAKIAFLALFLFVVTLGGSYALFTTTKEGTKQTEVVSGTLTIEYEDKNEISLNNTAPLSNEEGLHTDGYTFTIKNTGTLNGKYTISLEEKENNTLDKNYIKYSIREEGKEWSTPALLSSGLIIKENILIESKKETTYELKIWLDEKAPNEVQGKTYSAKVVVSTVQANTTQVVTTNPIIEINGEKIVKIEENTEYVDTGISSIKSTENINKENITTRYEYYDGITTVEVERIDTSKVGIYYIYYEIEDSKGNKGITTRVVNVYKKDTNIPTILLKGESLISLDYNEEYIEAGYTATDIEDLDLTNKVIVEGRVNKEVAGTYIIKYIVIDSSGNTSSVTREVIVNERNGEISLVATSEENENITSTITIEGETENNKMYYAVTNTSEKPSDSEYKEMDLVTELSNTKSISPSKLNTIKETKVRQLSTLKKFKKEIEIVKNGTYYIFIKDDKNNIETEEVKVTNIDETKPTCVFSNTEYVGLNKTVELTLTCTDPADITNEEILKEYFEVDNKISIEIGNSTKVEKGYSYPITVTGKQEGIYTLKLLSNKITDKVGNSNESLNKEIKVTNIEISTSETKLDINGLNSHQIEISGTNQGSINYTSNDSSIALVDNEGLITGVSPGETTIKVTEANGQVSKEIKVTVVKTLTANFTKQGTGVTGISSTQEKCEVVDSSEKCTITLPSITVSSGYTALGWNTNKTATTGDTAGTEITLTGTTTTYYTISRKDEITLKATFNKNGAASQTVKGGTASTAATVEVSCKLPAVYNTATQASECDITTPVITASTATPTVVGYATSSDATTASVQPNASLTLSSNKTYYAITKSEVKTYTATFNLNGASKLTNASGTAVAEAVTRTCNIPVTYNGVSQATSCEITTPTITASTNTPTVCGFTTSTTGTSTCTVKHNSTQNLTADIEYYAQTYKAKTTKSVAFKIAADSNVSKITSGSTSVTNTTDSITLTCDIAAVYNGATQATSCNVTSPTITPATGYKSAFWGTSATATSGTTSGGSVSSATATYYARALTGNSYTVNYYDGTTLKGSSTATVGTSFTLKTASSLGLSKTGYTFKGWATTSGSTTVTHTDGKSVSNLTTTDGGTVNLYAVWKDETSPSCSWSTPGTITTGNTTTLTLTCTDTGSGLSSQTLSTSNFSVSSTTYGSVTAVSSPTAVTNGYKYTVTVKGLSSGSTATTNGSFTVSLNASSIKDGANNNNTKTTSGTVTVKGRSYTAEFVKQGTGVTAIGSTSLGCTSVGTATTCNVTLPTITVSSGYTAVGWSTSSTSTTGTAAGTSVTLSANTTYYSISYKNAITLSAAWNANGATLSSTTTSTCELAKAYNSNTQATSCTVTAPTITRSGYEIVGYNTSASSTTSALSSGGTLTLTSSNTGKTWYAITYKTITITYKLNGASKLTNASGTAVASDVTRTCTMYNTATSCSVTSPTITASTNTPSIYGFSTAAATHSNGWSVNTAKSVSANATWYAQTYKSAVTRTLSYTTSTGVASLSRTTSDTCQIAATYNGSAQGTSCSITTTLPSITASANYVTLGWYNGTTKVADSGASYTVSLSSNLTLTAKAQAAVAKNVIDSTTTYYLSLQEAVNAASTSTTTATTLLQNTAEAIVVPSTVESINLNLNGKMLTGSIANYGYLTVRNGTIYNGGTVLDNVGGTMILNGLSISSNGPGAVYVLYNRNGGLLSITGDVTTNSSSTTHYTVALYNESGCSANIDGLTIESAPTSYGVVNHGGTVNMSNSYINTTEYWPYLNRNNGTSVLKNCTIANTNPNSYYNELGSSTLYDVTIPATVSGNVIRYQYVGSGHARISLYGHTGLYTNVYMPTWTVNNEQDDVQWYLATIASDSTGSYHYYDIYSSNHNNELGPFHTHVYTRNTSTGAAETYLAGINYNIQHY